MQTNNIIGIKQFPRQRIIRLYYADKTCENKQLSSVEGVDNTTITLSTLHSLLRTINNKSINKQ
jgi:hypothetical protein